MTRRSLSFVSALALAAAVSTGMAGPGGGTARAETPWFGARSEELRYTVHFGPARIANARLRLGCVTDAASGGGAASAPSGPRYVAAMASANSQGFAGQVYRIDLRLDSFIAAPAASPGSASGARALEARTRIVDRGRTRYFQSRFAPAAPAPARVKRLRGDTFEERDVALPSATHDLLSWVFELRQSRDWKRGTTHTYFVWDGWKLVRLDAHIGALESVWTPDGIRRAQAVELTRTRLFHSGEKLHQPRAGAEPLGTAWFSVEADRLPVAARLQMPIGEVRVVLERARVARCSAAP